MATVSHETTVFDVNDAKVYKLLTDVAGASPTYGAAVDVPGIADVSMDPNLVTAELKGDARILAKKGKVDRFNFSCTYGKLAGDVLNVVLGTTNPINTATKARFRAKSPSKLPYFMLQFKIEDLDEGIGDLHTIMYKCQVTGGTLLGTSSDNFGQPTLECEAIAINGSLEGDANVMVDWDILSTVTALRA